MSVFLSTDEKFSDARPLIVKKEWVEVVLHSVSPFPCLYKFTLHKPLEQKLFYSHELPL